MKKRNENETPTYVGLRDKISIVCRSRGFSMRSVIEKTGSTSPDCIVNKIRWGGIQYKRLMKMADILGCTVSYLISGGYTDRKTHNIYEAVKYFSVKKDKKMKELALAAGYGSSYAMVHSLRNNVIRYNKLDTIARELGITVLDLITLDGLIEES